MPVSPTSSYQPPSASSDSARREAVFVMAMWLVVCLYVVGYAALFAYGPDAASRSIAGIPSWVVWGVLAPWVACTVVTCVYSLYFIRDEELGEERPGGEHPGDGDAG
jgi:hypothetical protein